MTGLLYLGLLLLLMVGQLALYVLVLWVAGRLGHERPTSFRRAAAVGLALVLVGYGVGAAIIWVTTRPGLARMPQRAMLVELGLVLFLLSAMWQVIRRAMRFSRGRAAAAVCVLIAVGGVAPAAATWALRETVTDMFRMSGGSMAPVLYGAHHDLVCPQCAYEFSVSVSATDNLPEVPLSLLGICPICRTEISPGDRPPPPVAADRILVDKWKFPDTAPARWDIVLFHFRPWPDDTGPAVVYTARVVGLPHEAVTISQGDVFVGQGEQARLLRKPPAVLLAMRHLVHDQDHQAQWQQADPAAPPRWHSAAKDQPGWKPAADARWFEVAADEPWQWLRYEHRLPGGDGPLLVTDFAACNTNFNQAQPPDAADRLGLHWVGDLLLECRLDWPQAAGQCLLELVEGGRRHQCRLDFASGNVELLLDDGEDQPRVLARCEGAATPGHRQLRFANCDDQLHLWIDDTLVEFDGPTEFSRRVAGEPIAPAAADLAPAGIAVRKAQARVGNLRLYRDAYYIATQHSPFAGVSRLSDFASEQFAPAASPAAPSRLLAPFNEDRLRDVLSNPRHFRAYARALQSQSYQLGPGEYFVLGDNSPRANDSRLWPQSGLPQHDLVGRAVMICWPAARWQSLED